MVDYTHSIIPSGFTLTKIHLKPMLVQKILSAFQVAVHVHMQYPGISHQVQVVYHTKYLHRHKLWLFQSYSTSKGATHPYYIPASHEDSDRENNRQAPVHIPCFYPYLTSSAHSSQYRSPTWQRH